MKKTIVPVILFALSIGLAIASFIILPDSVVIQFSLGTGGNTSVPKLFAILIPTVLGVGGAVSSYALLQKGNEAGKSLLVSTVGIVLFITMIIVNCLL